MFQSHIKFPHLLLDSIILVDFQGKAEKIKWIAAKIRNFAQWTYADSVWSVQPGDAFAY